MAMALASVRLEEVTSDSEEEPAAAVGYSALEALSVAVQDEAFDERAVDLASSDADLDADEIDAALSASVAYANGAILYPGSDHVRRREFWEWWLKEAVPAAWAAECGRSG